MVGIVAALGSAACWALAGIVVRDVAGRAGAFYITAIRTVVAAVVVLAIFVVIGPYQALFDLPTSTLALLFATGLIGALGDTAFVRALAFEDASRMFTVSTGLYIFASVSGSIVFSGESFSVQLLIAGIAVLIGARLVLQRQSGKASPALVRARKPMTALLLAVLAAILWAFSLLVLSDAMESVNALAASAFRLPLTALFLLLITGLRGEHRRPVKRSDLGPISLNGAFMAGATMMFLLAVKEGDVGTVAVLTSTSPIFVAPLAHFFLKEKVTLVTGSGIAISMAGVWLASI